jgi:hypothetical protein
MVHKLRVEFDVSAQKFSNDAGKEEPVMEVKTALV